MITTDDVIETIVLKGLQKSSHVDLCFLGTVLQYSRLGCCVACPYSTGSAWLASGLLCSSDPASCSCSWEGAPATRGELLVPGWFGCAQAAERGWAGVNQGNGRTCSVAHSLSFICKKFAFSVYF